MRQKLFLIFSMAFLLSASMVGWAQDINVKPSVVSGDVSLMEASKIVLQTKDGAIDVMLTDKTEFKRVSAENPSLRTATPANLADIANGDRLTVTGFISADKKSIPARAVYLMTKSDIASKQTKETEQWRTRGISGQVAAINPQTKEITVSTRGVAGETKTALTLKNNARFRRYAQDSVSYNEAKNSSFEEIKVGDMIRALGDRSTDNAGFNAEEIITGSFQTIGGTIKAINPAKNEITITNVQTKKDLTVIVGQNSVLKQFPAELAQRLAGFQAGGAGGGVRPPQQGTNPAAGQTPPANGGMRPNGGMGGGMRGGGGGGIDDMLDRFPNITINDLKVGSMIAFSSTRGTNLDRVTAIKLLSGVEPFINTPQRSGNSGGRGTDAGFTIPGLDGGGLP